MLKLNICRFEDDVNKFAQLSLYMIKHAEDDVTFGCN